MNRQNVALATTLVLGGSLLTSTSAFAAGLQNEANFNNINGATPRSSLARYNSSPILYGTALQGGALNEGTIFSFNTSTKVITNLADFNGTNGAFPQAGLSLFNGKFYGTSSAFLAEAPGVPGSGPGTLFSFDPTAPVNTGLTKLADFSTTIGLNPAADLTFLNGRFYGTALQGGSAGVGTIFSFDPNNAAGTLIKEADFTATDGIAPTSKLTSANGLLYGTTFQGGSTIGQGPNGAGFGTLYSFNPVSKAINTVVNFNQTNGSLPTGGVTLAGNGLLYGATSQGGPNDLGNPTGPDGDGTLYSFDPVSQAFTSNLVNFNGISGDQKGANVVAPLSLAADGKLYGTTAQGGLFNSGTVESGNGTLYSFTPLTNTFTKLADFSIGIGANPVGAIDVSGLTVDPSGRSLYGVAQFGGLLGQGPLGAGFGTVYSFTFPSAPVTTTPEPSSLFGLIALGGGALALRRKRR